MLREQESLPLVSIVIPVYNGANYLREAIDSALSQSYPNCEIIVVNDGSTDEGRTEQIALSYGNQIRYFSKKNGKVSSALNLAIREMKGAYFAWLSHDDIFYPDKIEKQMNVMKAASVNLVAASCDFFMDNGRKVPFRITECYDRELLERSVFPVVHGMIQFGGILMRRSLFDKYGLFREDLYTTQDYEFLFRILRKEKCVFMDDIVNGVRCHSAQVGNTSPHMEKERDEMYAMFLTVLSEAEREQIYGSSYNFYYQMMIRLIALPDTRKSFPLCIDGLNFYGEGESGQNVQNDQTIYIYGAGRNGRRFLFDLRCRGMQVQGFLDKNEALKGQMIDGIMCQTLENLDNLQQDRVILIASEFREEMAEALEGMGVKAFQYKEEYEQKHGMIHMPPPVENVIFWIQKYKECGWKNA